jgi:hypothetical protein
VFISLAYTLSFRPKQNEEQSDSFCIVEKPAVLLVPAEQQVTRLHSVILNSARNGSFARAA